MKKILLLFILVSPLVSLFAINNHVQDNKYQPVTIRIYCNLTGGMLNAKIPTSCEIKYKYFVFNKSGGYGYGNPSKREDGFLVVNSTQISEPFLPGDKINFIVSVKCNCYGFDYTFSKSFLIEKMPNSPVEMTLTYNGIAKEVNIITKELK